MRVSIQSGAPLVRLLLLAVSALPLALATAPQPSGWVVLFHDDFETIANDWEIWPGSGGSWQRVKDGANTVYAGQGGASLNLANPQWSDYRFRSRVKVIGGGLTINYRSRTGVAGSTSCSHYSVAISSAGLDFSRAFSCGPPAAVLVHSEKSLSFGVWHEIEIVGIGANIKTYVDGVQTIDYTDPDPLVFGGINYQSSLGGTAYVDDVEVTGPPVLQVSWVKTGGPWGGMGYDIKMRPDNPDVLFATDNWSGVNKSVDGGRTWFSTNAGITARTGDSGDAIPVFCVTIDPNNPDIVWAGLINIRGIYKSLDGGATWVEKDNGVKEQQSLTFRGFTVDWHNSNVVYAAAEVGHPENAGTVTGVVYRTTDGGENWTAIWRGDNLARYVLIDPRNSNVIYVSTGIFDRAAANSDLDNKILGGVGVVKSTDGGTTWKALGPANGLLGAYVGSLFMHPKNPDILLAAAGHADRFQPDGGDGGVYRTIDGGEHWVKTIGGDQFSAVEIAASDPSIVYGCAFAACYRSQDGGLTWRLMSSSTLSNFGPPGTTNMGFPIDLQADPRNPDRVFLNSYGGGNFLTEDGGATWQMASKGYTGATLQDLAVDPRDPSRVYVEAISGFFRSDNLGADWRALDSSVRDYHSGWATIALDPSNPERILLTDAFSADMFVSSDGGRNFDLLYKASWWPTLTGDLCGFWALSFAPSNPKTIYAGRSWSYPYDIQAPAASFGIWKSTDGGRTWADANDSHSARENILRIVVDPRSENVAYAASSGSGVLRTDDGGKSWRSLKQGLPTPRVLALAMDPGNSSTLYAGLYDGAIYKTVNGGESWQMAAAGMDPQANVRSIVVDPNNPQVLYAADIRTGVFRSADGGKLWAQVNNGLSVRAVERLALSADSSTLYAAVKGGGLYRLDLKARGEGTLAALPAASFVQNAPVAPESAVSVYGQGLASGLLAAGTGTLPTALGETQVCITDSDGLDAWAPLYFVSPGQINFMLPAGMKNGTAQIRVFRQNSIVARGTVQVETVAPGVYTANSDGKGAPAAILIRSSAGGIQTQAPAFQCGATAGSCVTAPLDLGADTDTAVLMLFGTGIRGVRSASAVSVRIGGVSAPVSWAGAQGQFAGLDQVNVKLPSELRGRGEVDLALTIAGRAANVVKIQIR